MSTKTKPGAVGQRGRQVLAQQIEAAFEQPIPKPRLSEIYQIALLITTLLVVALPLIYIAMIVGVGYGVYQYAIHGMEWVGLSDGASTRAGRMQLFAYIAPLGMGVVLIGFMIKPFLAPRIDRVVGPTLSREDQPLLFDFIERLCVKLGAPVPKRIEVMADVNAFAAFRRGWLSFFGRDLILSIGLPLAAGLSVRQLGGIIAHEFGHFRQSTAMRLNYLTYSVNNWFARVVYTRDGWDQALMDGVNSGVGYVMAFCLLMQLAVWLTRRVLWVLMTLSHCVSCFMSRQMEYDADKAFAAIAGSPAVGTTLARLNLLSATMQEALHTNDEGMSSQELYDNLPEYVAKSVRLYGQDQTKRAFEQMMQERTGLFSTHPSLRQRVTHASELEAAGILSIDADASLLFNDFRKTSKAVTYAFYRHHLGDALERYRLVKTEQAINKLDERGARLSRLERYLGVYEASRPPRIELDPPTAPDDAKQVLAELKAARGVMAEQCNAMKEAHAAASQAEQDFILASVSITWMRFAPAQMRAKAPPPLMSAEEAKNKAQQAEEALKRNRASLRQMDRAVNQRLSAAIKLLMSPDLDRVAPQLCKQQTRACELITTLRDLSKRHPQMTRLDIQAGILNGWCATQQLLDNNAKAQAYTQQLAHSIRDDINQLAQSTASLARPVQSDQGHDDSDTYAVDEEQLAAAQRDTSDRHIDFTPLHNLHQLNNQALGELVDIAEAIEALLKLGPVFRQEEVEVVV